MAAPEVEEAAGFPERELVRDGDCWGEFPEPAAAAVLGPGAVPIAPGLCGEAVCEVAAWPEFGAAAVPVPVGLALPEPEGAGLLLAGPLLASAFPAVPTPLGALPGSGFPGWPAPGATAGVPVVGLITTAPLEIGLP